MQHNKKNRLSLPFFIILFSCLLLIFAVAITSALSKSKFDNKSSSSNLEVTVQNTDNSSKSNAKTDIKNNSLESSETQEKSSENLTQAQASESNDNLSVADNQETDIEKSKIEEENNIKIKEIERLYKMYDYDAALKLLEEFPEKDSEQSSALKLQIEDAKNSAVAANPEETMHIFFHSLIYNTDKAFDGDFQSPGYNQFMTTRLEFDRILEDLYERDFVLISMHDLAKFETDENGKKVAVRGEILLPPNKKPLILSVDDVNYYEYMKEDGFANRLVLDQNNNVTCSMVDELGLTVLGDFDVVPILDKFVEKHPDFSYKGAKGILALTGYEGALGYRTDERYKDQNPNYEQDIADATKVAQVLKDTGWEFASHSWGHQNLGTMDFDNFKQDADRWEKNVESIVGKTDIMIYPFGADIVEGMTDYTFDNPRFAYLKEKGFDYFCTVDGSKHYTTHIREDYVKQGRRNLDGYRLFHNPDLVDDLINAAEVLDQARPLPVPDL